MSCRNQHPKMITSETLIDSSHFQFEIVSHIFLFEFADFSRKRSGVHFSLTFQQLSNMGSESVLLGFSFQDKKYFLECRSRICDTSLPFSPLSFFSIRIHSSRFLFFAVFFHLEYTLFLPLSLLFFLTFHSFSPIPLTILSIQSSSSTISLLRYFFLSSVRSKKYFKQKLNSVVLLIQRKF